MSSTIYTHLDPEAREVRLLRLHSSPNKLDSIECGLLTVSLDSQPSFKALSYTWGNTEDTQLIAVNGHSVRIGQNLFDALVQLRTRESPLDMWADAICINQSDDDEKTHQVGIMKDIYQAAEEVVVWLGRPPPRQRLANDDSFLVMEAIKKKMREAFEASADNMVAVRPTNLGDATSSLSGGSPVVVMFRHSAPQSQLDPSLSCEAKVSAVLGSVIHKGLLPGDLRDIAPFSDSWIPENQPALRDLVTAYIRKIRMGPVVGLSDPEILGHPKLGPLLSHVCSVEAIEDAILTDAELKENQECSGEGRVHWSSETTDSPFGDLFTGAFQRAVLPQDFHIIGAFRLIQLFADGTHIHDLPFFSGDRDNLAYYPSLFWRRSVEALRDMLLAPYWRRVWIIQELVLSRSSRIIYGDHSIPWQVLWKAVVRFNYHHEKCCGRHFTKEGDGLETWWWALWRAMLTPFSLFKVSMAIKMGQQLKLATCLTRYVTHSQASDPRDYIYGLLGLVNDGGAASMIPNYRLNPREVFIQASMILIEDRNRLDILVTKAIENTAVPDLPSWTRDFSCIEWKVMMPIGITDTFDASKGLTPCASLVNNTVLEAKSIKIDTISHLTNASEEEIRQIVPQLLEVSKSWGIAESEFWQTVFCGHVESESLVGDHARIGGQDLNEIVRWAHSWLEGWRIGNPPPKNRFERTLEARLKGTLFFKTPLNRIALGINREANPMRTGDEVHIISGCAWPVILRPCAMQQDPLETKENSTTHHMDSSADISLGAATSTSKKLFQLISICYLHGWMYGEESGISADSLSPVFLV